MGVNIKGQILAGRYCPSSAGFNRAATVYISRDMLPNTEYKKAASHVFDLEATVMQHDAKNSTLKSSYFMRKTANSNSRFLLFSSFLFFDVYTLINNSL